jgi:hypothetical protein
MSWPSSVHLGWFFLYPTPVRNAGSVADVFPAAGGRRHRERRPSGCDRGPVVVELMYCSSRRLMKSSSSVTRFTGTSSLVLRST